MKIIEQINIKNCPLCGKSHSYNLELDEDPVMYHITSMHKKKTQTLLVYLTCPYKNLTFKAHIARARYGGLFKYSITADLSVVAGLSIIIFGAIVAVFSYLVALNIPLTALGLTGIIVGATIAFTSSTPIPQKAVRTILRGAYLNIEALLEEFNVEARAIYMPPRDGRVYAFIPLSKNRNPLDNRKIAQAPLKVLTNVKETRGLIVFPPGSEIAKSAGVTAGVDSAEAVNLTLVEFLEVANHVIVEKKRF